MNTPLKTDPRFGPSEIFVSRGECATSSCPVFPAKRGFALIISLTLMAFILLLLVTLVSLTQIETQSAASQLTSFKARSNAVLGMQIALGELQKHAGVDQRATAPATTVYPPKDVVAGTGDLYDNPGFGFRSFADESVNRSYLDLVKGGTFLNPSEREAWDAALNDWWNDGANSDDPGAKRNPHWTGIYDTTYRVDRFTNPDSPDPRPRQVYENDPGETVFGEFNRTQLPRWIVSGNERIPFAPPDDQSPVTTYPSGYLTPDRPLRDQLSADQDEEDIVTVVGIVDPPNSKGAAVDADNSADGIDGRVEVIRQRVAGPDAHYAYWVADESIKANFAVRDPYANAPVGSVDYRNRLQVPQRLGWERMEGFDEAFDRNNIDVFSEIFEKVVVPSQFRLVDPALNPSDPEEDPLRRNFHSLTSFSRGLFTDPVLGGLKKDLTHYLENRSGGPGDNDPVADPDRYDDDDPRFAAYGGDNDGFPGTTEMSLIELPNMPNRFPTFGRLQEWYRNEATGGGSGSIDPTEGAEPVLTYYNLMAGFSRNDRTVNMHVAPQFVLWNPYDAALESTEYIVEIAYSYTANLFVVAPLDPEFKEIIDPNTGNEVYVPGPTIEDPSTPWVDEDGDDIDNDGQDDGNGIHDNLDNTTPGVPTGPNDDPTDGINDMFGNYYYYLTPAGHFASGAARAENKEINTKNDDKADNGDASFLEGREFGFTFTPFRNGNLDGNQGDLPVNPATGNPVAARQRDRIVIPGGQPQKSEIDHILRFRITAGFEAGQAKIFSVRSDQQWSPGDTIDLAEGIDTNNVDTMYFPVAEMNPSVPIPSNLAEPDAHVRIFATSGNFGQDKNTPYVRLAFADGDETISETMDFGSVGNAGRLRRWFGNEWYQANKKNKEDRRPDPYGVVEMRQLNQFGAQFKNNFMTQNQQDYSDRTASNFELSRGFIQPFTHSPRYNSNIDSGNYMIDLAGRDDGYRSYQPVFSRFNLGSTSLTENLLVESRRSGLDVNINHNTDWLFNLSGLGRTTYGQDWDEYQYDGPDGAYAIIAATRYDDDGVQESDYEPLTHLAIRNVKRPNSEILSLGQLQQINLSPYNWLAAFPIGNSDAPPYTDREAIAGLNSREMGTKVNHNGQFAPPEKTPNNPNNYLLDISYLLNENLWDRFFLSSLPDSFDTDNSDPLPNSRIRFDTDLIAEEGATSSDVKNFDDAAAYLNNFGGFNVNSTSVEAWKALLTSFRDLELEAQSGGRNPGETVPIARSLDPVENPVEFTFAAAGSAADTPSTYGADNTRDYSNILGGFRYLSDPEIEALAERIVDEVRLRGPFYSVADFVNRRLVAPEGANDPGTPWHGARTDSDGFGKGNGRVTDFINPAYDPFPGLSGLNGAIQRAINVSGINGGINYPDAKNMEDDRVFGLSTKDLGGMSDIIHNNSGSLSNAYSDNNTYLRIEPARRHHLDAEHIAGAPASEAGQLLQGAPGFVTQGDILSMIGPALTARGDTFLIRSYGDVVDPVTGEVTSRAYLETVVQRKIKPVNPYRVASEADGIRADWIPADEFGRKFEIVSIRWLGDDEI